MAIALRDAGFQDVTVELYTMLLDEREYQIDADLVQWQQDAIERGGDVAPIAMQLDFERRSVRISAGVRADEEVLAKQFPEGEGFSNGEQLRMEIDGDHENGEGYSYQANPLSTTGCSHGQSPGTQGFGISRLIWTVSCSDEVCYHVDDA